MKITIPNRVLIGHRSKNGRYYTKKALESCIPHAEGKKVFLNHPEKGERRKFEDLLGTARNLHYSPQGLRGDLEFDGEHEQAKRIAKLYEDKLPLGGISVNCDYTLGTANGKTWVVSIDDIDSFDYVAEPATTDILESEEPQMDEQLEKEVVNFVSKADFDALQQRLQALEAKAVEPVSVPVAPQMRYEIPNQKSIDDLIRNCR
jgi:hypothetical protein